MNKRHEYLSEMMTVRCMNNEQMSIHEKLINMPYNNTCKRNKVIIINRLCVCLCVNTDTRQCNCHSDTPIHWHAHISQEISVQRANWQTYRLSMSLIDCKLNMRQNMMVQTLITNREIKSVVCVCIVHISCRSLHNELLIENSFINIELMQTAQLEF